MSKIASLPWGSLRPWVTRAAGAVLLTAAVMKLQAMWTTQVVLEAESARWVGVALINGEIALACWLISGVRQQTGSWVGAIVFFGFGAYTLGGALNGAKSCGCFGKVVVNPWTTFALDFTTCIFLLWSAAEPSNAQTTRGPRRRGGLRMWLFSALGTGLIALTNWVGFSSQAAGIGLETGKGDEHAKRIAIDESKKRIVLEPREWQGYEFPLVENVDIGKKLVNGRWIVLMYHSDCPECQRAVPNYEHAAEVAGTETGVVRFAFIDVPTWGGSAPPDGLFHSEVPLHGRLDSSHEWFVTTPVAMAISDGHITEVVAGAAAVNCDWIDAQHGRPF